MSPFRAKGFTLLEILAAIAILAIVLTALFRLHLQTLSMGADARFYSVAPLLAQKKIAELQVEGLQQIRTDAGDFGDEFPRYRWEAAVFEVESDEFDEVAKMLRGVEVRVFDQAEETSYRLRSYQYVKPD